MLVYDIHAHFLLSLRIFVSIKIEHHVSCKYKNTIATKYPLKTSHNGITEKSSDSEKTLHYNAAYMYDHNAASNPACDYRIHS